MNRLGEDGDLKALAECRIVDTREGTIRDKIPIASVMAHSPMGWTDRAQTEESFPTIDELLEMVDMEAVPEDEVDYSE